MTWHIARGSAKRGPISQSQIARLIETGRLQPTDHVWREGMPAWKPLTEVEELSLSPNSSASSAPPLPRNHVDTKLTPGGYVVSHWQGRFGLAKSFWVNGVVTWIMFQVIFFVLIVIAANIDPSYVEILWLAYVLMYLALAVWHPVGLYRSAINQIRNSKPRSTFWAHVSLIYSGAYIPMFFFISVAIISGVVALGAEGDAAYNSASTNPFADDNIAKYYE